MSDDWDVDSYKSEFENEEHWQLRRNFMLAHKDKFPEDQLVCLAQAFTNVEFMGCRYPDETMVRIAELAKGVVEKFREERKNCLKRTFVAASEAASAKAKGRTNKPKEFDTSKRTEKIEKTEENSQSTKAEVKEEISVGVYISNLSEVKSNLMEQDEKSEVYNLVNLDEKTNSRKLTKEERWKAQLKNFVLILSSENDKPVSVLHNSVTFNKCYLRWKFEKCEDSSVNCQFSINNHPIATGNGRNRKISKEQTAMAVVAKFRESHYAIKMKCEFSAETVVTPAHVDSGQLPVDSIKQTSIDSEELSIVSVPKESSIVSIPKESPIVSIPKESSIVSIPKESSIVSIPKESSIVSIPKESSIVSVPKKSSIVSVPKESSICSVSKKSKEPSNGLGEDNIGRRIMILMGWKGGGLGTHEQGIKDPIIPTGRHTKKGLGNPEKKKKNPTIANVKNKKKGLGNAKQEKNKPATVSIQNTGKGLESQEQNPKPLDPIQNPKTLDPIQKPKTLDPIQNPKLLDPIQNPKLLNPIQNPPTVTVQNTKKGSVCGPLSAEEEAQNMAFNHKAKELIRYWMKNKLNEWDLVFSSGFTSEQRKMMHKAAKMFSLKSKSYGKGSKRHLVISRKPDALNIVQELLKMGGSSERYELLYPTKTQTQLPSCVVFHDF